jgi:hypothetical protein
MSKRNRFDLPEFFRKPEYYEFLKNSKESDIKKILSYEPIDIDIIERKYKARLEDSKSKYNSLLNRFESLDKQYNDLLLLSEQEIEYKKIKPIKSARKHEATAKVTWSDWHVDEVVNPKKVNGLNKYNPEIAKKRSELCAINTIKLVEKERRDVKIDNFVLHLGGDFIGGWIHEELQQTNSMSPIDATIYATELLGNSLEYVIEKGKFKRIVAIPNWGNHGRTTKKMQIANQGETNFEKIIYHNLKAKFGSKVEFVIDDSTLVYYKIYDLLGRFFHGQQIKYNGGIGGLSIPLIKKIAFWDKTIKAAFNSLGHFHTLGYYPNETTVNASLKGFDTFAQEIGASFEPPRQAFQLIDSQYGVTIKAPIICE